MGEMWVAAKSLIIFNRRTLLLKRSAFAGSGVDEWEFPGGGLRFGEELLEGLAREIMEETGLTVRTDRLLYAMTHVMSPQLQIVGLTYLSYADAGEIVLSEEHKDYVWATRKQFMELLNKPMLDDINAHAVLDILDID